MSEIKPLNWTPQPGVGMSVSRRPDGGMNLTFTNTSEATLQAWREFALEHLLGPGSLPFDLKPDVILCFLRRLAIIATIARRVICWRKMKVIISDDTMGFPAGNPLDP